MLITLIQMYDCNLYLFFIRRMIDMLKECAYHILQPIGGYWESDEALFHIVPDGNVTDEEQEAVMKLLFD